MKFGIFGVTLELVQKIKFNQDRSFSFLMLVKFWLVKFIRLISAFRQSLRYVLVPYNFDW